MTLRHPYALHRLLIEAPKQAVKGSVDSMTFNAAMNNARDLLRRAGRLP